MPGPDRIYEYIDEQVSEAIVRLRTELLDQILPLESKIDMVLSLLVETKALILSQNIVNMLLHAEKRDEAKQIMAVLQAEVEHLRGRLKEFGDPLQAYADWHSRCRERITPPFAPQETADLLDRTRDLFLHPPQSQKNTP